MQEYTEKEEMHTQTFGQQNPLTKTEYSFTHWCKHDRYISTQLLNYKIV